MKRSTPQTLAPLGGSAGTRDVVQLQEYLKRTEVKQLLKPMMEALLIGMPDDPINVHRHTRARTTAA